MNVYKITGVELCYLHKLGDRANYNLVRFLTSRWRHWLGCIGVDRQRPLHAHLFKAVGDDAAIVYATSRYLHLLETQQEYKELH